MGNPHASAAMLEESNVIPFIKTHCYHLKAEDGRRWDASLLMPPEQRYRLQEGQRYTLRSLLQDYQLYRWQDGRPGLVLYEGEEYPEELTYEVERLRAGQE